MDGVAYLKPGAFRLEVIQDDGDPWGMLVTAFPKKCGCFRVMSPAASGAFSGTDGPLDGVRVIEDGAVRTVVEAVLQYRHSRAVVQYVLSKLRPYVDVRVRLQWMEIQQMVKLRLPPAGKLTECIGQEAFGEESLPLTGRENVSGSYLMAVSGDRCVGLINNGVHGSSVQNGALGVTLIRSPAYCAHPIADRPLLPQDRFTPHADQGERLYEFRLLGGETAAVRRELPRLAENFSQPPMLLSFFPAVVKETAAAPSAPLLRLTGDPVTVSALKQARDGKGFILRLFNASPAPAQATLHIGCPEKAVPNSFTPYEAKTLHLSEDTVRERPMADI